MEYGPVLVWLLPYLPVGVTALPLAELVFPRPSDRGAAFAIPLALAVIAIVGYFVGHVPFGWPALLAGLADLLGAGPLQAGPLDEARTDLDYPGYAESGTVFAVVLVITTSLYGGLALASHVDRRSSSGRTASGTCTSARPKAPGTEPLPSGRCPGSTAIASSATWSSIGWSRPNSRTWSDRARARARQGEDGWVIFTSDVRKYRAVHDWCRNRRGAKPTRPDDRSLRSNARSARVRAKRTPRRDPRHGTIAPFTAARTSRERFTFRSAIHSD